MEALGPLFVAPSEPDRFWILIALLAGLVISTGVVVVIRGRLPDIFSYAGLLTLPIFGYVLGNIHLLEESKRVEFCGSCHETMSPIVEAMKSNGDYLAGIHFRRGAVPHEHACYRCHSGYGLWGDTQAKWSGFNHMLHTITGSYEYPLQKQGDFDIKSCLDCHAQAAPFREAEAHRDPALQQALLGHELGCVGLCHPMPHPDEALNGASSWQASR